MSINGNSFNKSQVVHNQYNYFIENYIYNFPSNKGKSCNEKMKKSVGDLELEKLKTTEQNSSFLNDKIKFICSMHEVRQQTIEYISHYKEKREEKMISLKDLNLPEKLINSLKKEDNLKIENKELKNKFNITLCDDILLIY